jgi:hypothetical protein
MNRNVFALALGLLGSLVPCLQGVIRYRFSRDHWFANVRFLSNSDRKFLALGLSRSAKSGRWIAEGFRSAWLQALRLQD